MWGSFALQAKSLTSTHGRNAHTQSNNCKIIRFRPERDGLDFPRAKGAGCSSRPMILGRADSCYTVRKSAARTRSHVGLRTCELHNCASMSWAKPHPQSALRGSAHIREMLSGLRGERYIILYCVILCYAARCCIMLSAQTCCGRSCPKYVATGALLGGGRGGGGQGVQETARVHPGDRNPEALPPVLSLCGLPGCVSISAGAL